MSLAPSAHMHPMTATREGRDMCVWLSPHSRPAAAHHSLSQSLSLTHRTSQEIAHKLLYSRDTLMVATTDHTALC